MLESWIGTSEERTEVLGAAPARLLAATLDLPDSFDDRGAELPPLWHWLYFLPNSPTADLGQDGHPRRGSGLIPPITKPRRMFAGAEFSFAGEALRTGELATRRSTLVSVEKKNSRSGELVLLGLEHVISSETGDAVVTERDTLVYLEPTQTSGRQGAPQERPPSYPDWVQEIETSEVMAFRFSALTFNSHRIHYDGEYATRREGYPGLVVQGPLIALLLAESLRWHSPQRLKGFSFRSKAPVFVGETVHVEGSRPNPHVAHLVALTPDGRLATEATAELV